MRWLRSCQLRNASLSCLIHLVGESIRIVHVPLFRSEPRLFTGSGAKRSAGVVAELTSLYNALADSLPYTHARANVPDPRFSSDGITAGAYPEDVNGGLTLSGDRKCKRLRPAAYRWIPHGTCGIGERCYAELVSSGL